MMSPFGANIKSCNREMMSFIHKYHLYIAILNTFLFPYTVYAYKSIITLQMSYSGLAMIAYAIWWGVTRSILWSISILVSPIIIICLLLQVVARNKLA